MLTDADLATLLRPYVAQIVAGVRARVEAERVATFAADSDDSPLFRPAFTAEEVAKYADYFAADADGRYPFSMHRHFGMPWRAFADATGLVRVYAYGADGRGTWFWRKRQAAPSDSSDDRSFSDEDVKTFAAHKDGDTWQTGNRIYTKANGKITWKLAGAVPVNPAPTKAAVTPDPKQTARTAVAAAQRTLNSGKALSAGALAALPGHLANLTVPQIQAVKKALGVTGGKVKADHVQKLVAHAQAATAAKAARAAAAKGPTKTQQKAAAKATAVTAVNATVAKLNAVPRQPLTATELADLPKHLALLSAAEVQAVRARLGTWKEKTKTAQIRRLVNFATALSTAAQPPKVNPAIVGTPVSPPPPVAPPAPNRVLQSIITSLRSRGATPGVPPTPLFTGVDANGHHWVNGKQVAKPPDETHWETGKAQPGSLNGVDFKPAPPKFWEKTKDVDVGEPAPLKKIDRVGVMIQEPDGRVWIVQPTNGFGNRKFTLAGGGVEKGLTDQQNALKEVWEETGLQVEITGHLGDFEDSNNGNNGRLYIGRRVGGAPWDAKVESFIISNKTGKPAAESETVSLVTPEKAAQLLHRTDDLAQLMTVHPPKIDTPTSGKGSEPIKKLLAAIQPKARAYIAKQQAAGNYKPGNADLHAVQEMRGFNKKPNLVSKTDFDALMAKGDHIEMLRGVSGFAGKTADQLAEQFRSGDHFPGHGCFGAGTYCDSTKGSANAASGYAGGGGALLRVALPKTAKVIKQSELERMVPREPSDAATYGHHPRNQEWWGVQAALAGYDAIEVDGKSSYHGGYGKGYYVILNRGIATVQETNAPTGYTIR